MTSLSTSVPFTSPSGQLHDLVGRDSARAPASHVLDEGLGATVMARGGGPGLNTSDAIGTLEAWREPPGAQRVVGPDVRTQGLLAERGQHGNDVPALPPIDQKVPVRGEHLTVIGELGHANETGVRDAHRLVGVLA
jgi:hypothetical protein